MAVYVVAQLDVKNTNWQQEYGPKAQTFLRKHGGKVIVGPGHAIERLEGRKPLPNTIDLFLNKREPSSKAQHKCQSHHPQSPFCGCGSCTPK